jgi:hypothetical protein
MRVRWELFRHSLVYRHGSLHMSPDGIHVDMDRLKKGEVK